MYGGHKLPPPDASALVGTLQIAGGAAEVASGAALVTAGPDPVSKAIGIAMMMHGADTIAAGYRTLQSGAAQDTYVNEGLQAVGLSPGVADVVEAAVSIGAGAKAGTVVRGGQAVADDAARAASACPDPAGLVSQATRRSGNHLVTQADDFSYMTSILDDTGSVIRVGETGLGMRVAPGVRRQGIGTEIARQHIAHWQGVANSTGKAVAMEIVPVSDEGLKVAVAAGFQTDGLNKAATLVLHPGR